MERRHRGSNYFVVCFNRKHQALQVVGPFPSKDAAHRFGSFEASRAYSYAVAPGLTMDEYRAPAQRASES